MQWTISRRRFLVVSAALSGLWVTRGWWPKAAPVVARALEQVGIMGTELPMAVPTLIGFSPLGPEPTVTPTPTPTETPSPTPTPKPEWRVWLPWVEK